MSSHTNHESLFLRVNEGCAIILELSILHGTKVKKWFTEKHKQEMLVLILDAIQHRLRTVYDTQACKKEKGEQKKDGDQDLKGIIRGDTLKIGYKFSKRAVNLQCMLPDESVQSCPISDDCPYSGGGYNSIALFPEKLNLYVCEYHQSGRQQTTAELASAISTSGQIAVSISDYFSRATQPDTGMLGQTESAVKKKVKLKRIVENASKHKATTSSDSSNAPCPYGGFLSSEYYDNNSSEFTPTMATTSSIPDEYQCSRGDTYGTEDDEETQITVAKEPIYIDSEASSESTGSHVFDREDVTIRPSQQNSSQMVLKLKNKSSVGERRVLENDHEFNNKSKYLDKYSKKRVLDNHVESDGSEDHQDDGQRDENQTRGTDEDVTDGLPTCPGDEESAIDDEKEMDEMSDTVLISYEPFKLPNRSSKMLHTSQREVAKKNPGKNNKLQSKLKSGKQSAMLASRKRPLSDCDDGDESLSDGYTIQGPKTKKPLYNNSSESKNRISDIGSWFRQKNQEQSKDNRGQVVGSDAKENAEPNSSDVPSSVDVDIVDLCSDDEEEEDDMLSDNDSLIDVIGDKRDVRRLDEGDIAYLMKRSKQYLKNIFAGKIPCRRHQDYKAGGFLRTDLGHSVRFGPFTDEHQDTIMKALIRVFCRRHSQYFDYVSKVLLPEALAKICMDVHHISHQEAEKFLAETPSASFCM